jgi:hypothetical protein
MNVASFRRHSSFYNSDRKFGAPTLIKWRPKLSVFEMPISPGNHEFKRAAVILLGDGGERHVPEIYSNLVPGSAIENNSIASGQCSIGRVGNILGSAAVTRNGVKVDLNVGDLIYKNDVIQTRSDSMVDISFVDGTSFSLSPETTMTVREFIYDAAGSMNLATFHLGHGSFTFIAGNLAQIGHMMIETPVANMPDQISSFKQSRKSKQTSNSTKF